ncbi:MAG: hypothetical protein ORN85_08720, partial [Sediminibacterium sp.]|nr:hypothetical protein [Sediminibacterium sp.]
NQAGGVTSLNVSGNTGGLGTLNYRWYVNNTASTNGGTRISGAMSSSYTPSVSTGGISYYYAVLSNGSGLGACDSVISDTSGAINVRLVPRIQSSNLSSGGTYCNTDAIPAIVVSADNGTSGQTGGISYQWYYSKTLGLTGNAISGATLNAFTPYNDSIGTSYYTITVTNGYCSTSSQSSGIVVNRPPVITTAIGKAIGNYCINGGGQTALTIVATDALGGTNLTYQWYRNTVDANTGGVLMSSTTSSFTPTDTSAGTFYYYVVITNSIGGNNCRITSATSGAINIYTLPVISSSVLGGANYCFNTSPTNLSVVSSVNIGSVSVQWYRNTIASVLNGVLAGSGNSFTPRTDTTGLFYYYAVVRNISAPMACNATTSGVSGAIRVYNNPVISVQPSKTGVNYCQNQSGVTSLSVTAANSGGFGQSFQWYGNTSASNIGGTILSGATNNTYTPVVSTASTLYYYVVVKLNSGLGVCDSVISDTSGLIRVSVNPQITASSSSFNMNQTYCFRDVLPNLSITANDGSGGNAINYAWYVSKTSGQTGNILSGQTSNSYTPSGDSIGTNYYQVTVRNGYCSTSLQS